MATYRHIAYHHTFLRKQFCLLPRWHLLRKCTELLGHFLSWLLVLCSQVGLSVLCSGAHSEDMQVSHRDSSQQSLLWRCCSTIVSGYMQVILDVFTEPCWICKNKVQPNGTQCKVEEALVVHCATHTAWSNLEMVTLRLTAPKYGSAAELVFVKKVRKRHLFSWPFISATVFVTVTVRKVTAGAGSGLDVWFSWRLSNRPEVTLDCICTECMFYTYVTKLSVRSFRLHLVECVMQCFLLFILLLSILLTM